MYTPMFTHQLSYKFVALTLGVTFFFSPLTMYAATTYTPRTQIEMIAYLQGVLAQLQAQLAAQKAADSGTTKYSTRSTPNPFFVNVVSLPPTSVSRTRATLKGEVDKGGSAYLDVWFQYGEGSSLSRTEDVPQIIKGGRQAIVLELDDLDEDTTYSYRIVAEDERGYRQYGQTRTFTTIASASTQSFNGRPAAETEDVMNIRASSADVQGFVSMNDYLQGIAFFVYGSDRGDVEEAEDYDSFKDIPISAAIVNKKSVNNKFTGRNTVKTGIGGLSPATRYYYRACVEYYFDDELDNPRLQCGAVESFTTLNY